MLAVVFEDWIIAERSNQAVYQLVLNGDSEKPFRSPRPAADSSNFGSGPSPGNHGLIGADMSFTNWYTFPLLGPGRVQLPAEAPESP